MGDFSYTLLFLLVPLCAVLSVNSLKLMLETVVSKDGDMAEDSGEDTEEELEMYLAMEEDVATTTPAT